MRRVGFIWEKICDLENLRMAHKMAQKDKKYYKEVKMVNSDPDKYLLQIQNMLQSKTYKITLQDYSISIIKDKNKKRKLMKLSYFPHRIIQWAIMLQIEPIFMKVFCNHTCASIKRRGGKHAYNLVRKYMKDKFSSQYCLKLDISKFYPNVNHDVLKNLLRKVFKDKDLLELLDMIIDSSGDIGLPIGSYLSQFLSNFYLSYFDHWLKEDLKLKMVVRYMDDIVIFGPTSRFLKIKLEKMEVYLREVLKLEIKDNWQIFPSRKRGVDFLGYRFFGNFILLRKSTCKNFKCKLNKIKIKQDNNKLISYSEFCSVNSYIGWLSWCNSWRLYNKYVIRIIQSLIRYYKDIILKNSKPVHRENSVNRYKNQLNKHKTRGANFYERHGNCTWF